MGREGVWVLGVVRRGVGGVVGVGLRGCSFGMWKVWGRIVL